MATFISPVCCSSFTSALFCILSLLTAVDYVYFGYACFLVLRASLVLMQLSFLPCAIVLVHLRVVLIFDMKKLCLRIFSYKPYASCCLVDSL